MSVTRIEIPLKINPVFSVLSHGWSVLSPYHLTESDFDWCVALPSGETSVVSVKTYTRPNKIAVAIHTQRPLFKSDIQFIRNSLIRMFRNDEDFSEFWSLAKKHPLLKKCVRLRAGSFLRCNTVFEDLIKTLCTTNTHWRNTKTMIETLCQSFGQPCYISGNPKSILIGHSFPTPTRIANASAEELKAIGLGYRASYVKELAENIVLGSIDLENLRTDLDSVNLRNMLLSIRGIGPYAANHMLMLLGRYDFVPVDSDVRSYLKIPSTWKQSKTEKVVDIKYREWGKFKFLAYKIERILMKRNYFNC
jgi:3-methyladenine DNA glycosylase/8-oxoguanine DNA glycosylase